MNNNPQKAVVVVASRNIVKINATRAFENVFQHYRSVLASHPDDNAYCPSEFEFVSVDAPSGVSAQPMGDEETLKGALNRVAHIEKTHPDAQVTSPLFLLSFIVMPF